MQTVKRLYLYLMSGITLGVLLVGLRTVMVVLFEAIGLGRGSLIGGDPQADRQQLSLAAALIGVGLPVWSIHWWLAERGLRPGAADPEAERGSAVRALYLTLSLAVLLAFGATAAADLLRGMFQTLLGAGLQDYGFADTAGSLATLLVTTVAWGYHVSIRRRDMRAGPLERAAAWLPRVYLYGAALGAGLALLQSFGDLVTVVGDRLVPRTGQIGGVDSYQTASSLSAIVAAGVIWLGHWWYAGRLVADPSWRGASERPARLRVAYFVGVLSFSVFSVLRLCAEAFGAVLVPVLGATSAFGEAATGRDMARTVAVSLVSAVPWALAWWFHRRSLRDEAGALDDPQRPAAARRLDLHSAALVGLGFAAVGTAWLLGLLVDGLFGGNRTIRDDFYRSELSTFVPLALLGSAVWAWPWWRIRARFAADPIGEAASTIRRSYLLIILAASVIASLGSAALILYRLFGAMLGANLGGNTVSELSTPIGILVVAGAVALYHGQALRRDVAVRAADISPEAAAVEPAEAERRLILTGPPGSDLDAALVELRAGLPPGYRLDER